MNRRWIVLMPVVFVTYSLAYLDRANFSFGAAAGMAADLRISAAQSSLLGSLFFLGYFLFQVPGAVYAQTRSVRRLILAGLIGWGVLAAATGVIANLNLLYLDRFLLGVVESAVLPALLILQTRWFTRDERARANAFLVLGNPVTMLWMSLLSGYLAARLGWRLMFVIEGLPALAWAWVWWRIARDHPREAAWYPASDRVALEARLAQEQKAIAPVRNYAAAFASPRVMVLSAQYFLWSIGVYGFVIWLPSILKDFSGSAPGGMGMIELGWLSAVPYLAAILAEIAASAWSDRTGRRTAALWPCFSVAAAAFGGAWLLGGHGFWVNFALLVIAGAAMYAPYGPFYAYIPEILPANVAGGAMALINGMGALGSFAGAYGVGLLNGATGNANASYLLMAAAMAVSAAITFALPKR